MDKESEEREASMQKEIMRLRSVVQDLNMRLQTGRNYLMGVDEDKITVPDALESFGFGRNGLGE